MKVSEAIQIWDKLGLSILDFDYVDFEKAIDEVVGIENDMTDHPPLCQLTEEEIEALEDEADLKVMRERELDEPRMTWREVKNELGLDG